MRGVTGGIAVAALLLAAPLARADLMTFYIKNQVSRGVVVELRSRDRDKVWPGDGEVYLLERGEKKSVPITCKAGERICYGAWLNGDDRTVWGVGPDDDEACDDCCFVCVAKTTSTIDLHR